MSPNDRPDWLPNDPEQDRIDMELDDDHTFDTLEDERRDLVWGDGDEHLPAIREYDGNEWGDEADGIGGEWINRDTDNDDDWDDEIGGEVSSTGTLTFKHVSTHGASMEFDQAAGIAKLEQAISDHETDQAIQSVLNPPDRPAPDLMDNARRIMERKLARDSAGNEAEELHKALRQRGLDRKAMFMADGRDLWRMEALGLFKKAGYSSRKDFLADPENHQDSTRGNLAIHIFEIICVYFNIDFTHEVNRHEFPKPLTIELTRVGFRAFMILEKTLSDIHIDSIGAGGASNRLEWLRFRAEAEDWLIRALTLSTRDLQSEVYEDAGWLTYFSGPITPGTLRYVYDDQRKPIRARTVDEVIDLLGLSDLADDDDLTASIRGKAKDDEA